jgi:prepilin-type N-terminal cleavage/methylation domain-containing protein
MTSTRATMSFRRTAGFTLVELLVVFAIIAILAALTATAVFKVISVQRNSNTELTIKAASSLLSKHWTYVVNSAKNEAIPPAVMQMADFDPKRARVIWTKLRIKQEFPMNISEALYPYVVTGTNTGNLLGPGDLPGKKYYYDRIVQAFPQLANPNWPTIPINYPNGQATGQTSPPFTTAAQWPIESAFCLTMALQINRGSIVFNEESFAVNALSNEVFVPQSPGGRVLLYIGPKALVDGWGFPLAFYRWPVGNLDFYPSAYVVPKSTPDVPNGSKTPASSTVSSGVRNSTFPDPLDPEGTLMDPRWNNASNTSNARWFELYCHLVHVPTPWVSPNLNPPPYIVFTPYTEPVILSGGPDNTVGIAAQNGSPFLPDDMRYDSLGLTTVTGKPSTFGLPATFDNIASYKLRTGGSGDK